jgi:hypothetical protein
MFNLRSLAASVLDSIDSVAKDTLEEPKVSATTLRKSRNEEKNEDENNDNEENTTEEFLLPHTQDEVNDISTHSQRSLSQVFNSLPFFIFIVPINYLF